MKISAAEFHTWHVEAWPEGYTWKYEHRLDDGRDIYNEAGDEIMLAPNDVFTVPTRWVLRNADVDKDISVRSSIAAWRKKRDYVNVVISVRKSDVAAFLDHLNGSTINLVLVSKG